MASEDKSDFKHCPAFAVDTICLCWLLIQKRNACEVFQGWLLVYMMSIRDVMPTKGDCRADPSGRPLDSLDILLLC